MRSSSGTSHVFVSGRDRGTQCGESGPGRGQGELPDALPWMVPAPLHQFEWVTCSTCGDSARAYWPSCSARAAILASASLPSSMNCRSAVSSKKNSNGAAPSDTVT